MKKLIILLSLVAGTNYAINAQTSIDSLKQRQKIDTIEREAEFPGGVNAWKTYIIQNLNPNVPVVNGAPAGKYDVIILFIVNKDGYVTDIEPQTHFGYGMEMEAKRVIQASPRWNPGWQRGRYVNSYRRQPFTFLVDNK